MKAHRVSLFLVLMVLGLTATAAASSLGQDGPVADKVGKAEPSAEPYEAYEYDYGYPEEQEQWTEEDEESTDYDSMFGDVYEDDSSDGADISEDGGLGSVIGDADSAEQQDKEGTGHDWDPYMEEVYDYERAGAFEYLGGQYDGDVGTEAADGPSFEDNPLLRAAVSAATRTLRRFSGAIAGLLCKVGPLH